MDTATQVVAIIAAILILLPFVSMAGMWFFYEKDRNEQEQIDWKRIISENSVLNNTNRF